MRALECYECKAQLQVPDVYDHYEHITTCGHCGTPNLFTKNDKKGQKLSDEVWSTMEPKMKEEIIADMRKAENKK